MLRYTPSLIAASSIFVARYILYPSKKPWGLEDRSTKRLFDSGHDLIIAADASASDIIREIAAECGIDFDEDPASVVIDHTSYAVSNTQGDHTLIAADDFIQSDVQARCISDVKADTDHTSFLAGTLSLKEGNEVHLIRLNSESSELICEGLFSHPNEIWDISSCPFDHRFFSTVFSQGDTYGAAIWQIPELYGQLNSPQLQPIATLDAHTSKVKCAIWWPTGRHDKLVTVDDQNILLWNLDASNKTAQVLLQI